MVQSFAFGRSLVALALCSAAFAIWLPRLQQGLTTAQAVCSCALRRFMPGGTSLIVTIGTWSRSRWDAGVAQMRAGGLADANASLSHRARFPRRARRPVSVHRRRRRSAPLHWRQSHRPWQPVVRAVHEHGSAAFRLSGTGSDMASSIRELWPARIRSAGRRHRGDGTARRWTCRYRHGIDASGNPIVVSGNNGNRVREAPISRGRIYAYVVPTSLRRQERATTLAPPTVLP